MKVYPKILTLGHDALTRLFENEVEVTEKIDGSQFRIEMNNDGVLVCGTKATEPSIEQLIKDNLFGSATFFVLVKRDLLFNVLKQRKAKRITLFCETLRQPKHNYIQYGRVPKGHLYLFGCQVMSDETNYEYNLNTEELILLAKILSMEPVNVLYKGFVSSRKDLRKLLESRSVLSVDTFVQVEGIVIKNYEQTYPIEFMSTRNYAGFPLAGKWVREEYEEERRKEWKKTNKPIYEQIVERFITKSRLNKVILHLREQSKIENQKQDLQYLLPEFFHDFETECQDEIRNLLWEDVKKRLKSSCDKFVVKEYLEMLLTRQFGRD